MRGQFRQGFVEIGLAGRRHTIGILTEENLIHVEFENFLFAQRLFDPRGKDDFLDLAFGPTAAIQQEILHHLLGNRRGTAHVFTPRAHRPHRRRRDLARVITVVGIKILVLSRDKRLFHQIGNRICRGKQPPLFGEFINDTALPGINPADRGRGILRQ